MRDWCFGLIGGEVCKNAVEAFWRMFRGEVGVEMFEKIVVKLMYCWFDYILMSVSIENNNNLFKIYLFLMCEY